MRVDYDLIVLSFFSTPDHPIHLSRNCLLFISSKNLKIDDPQSSNFLQNMNPYSQSMWEIITLSSGLS